MATSNSSNKIDAIVVALVDAANDKNDDVQRAISSSLQTIGTNKSELVLTCCSSYLTKHPKLSSRHKAVILTTMKTVCDNAMNLPSELRHVLIKQAADEMISSKEALLDWQSSASGVLVSLGKRNCHDVMEALLISFQPGVVPNFYILQTIAHLAQTNAYSMVPFLKPVLGTLLSVMNDMKQDNIKCATAYALSKFSEAILEYLANIDKAPDPSVKKEMFQNEFSAACSVLFVWLQAKEFKLRLTTLEAISSCSHLISKEKYEEYLTRVIASILALYKRQTEFHVATQSLCMTLESGFENGCTALDTHIESLIQALFPQVCDVPDYSKPELLKNHNEVLRCFYLIVQRYPDQVLQLLVINLENYSEKNRVGSLNILRHLVNTLGSSLKDKINPLLELLKVVSKDNNVKVKQVMAPLIVSLAHHGYLECDVGSVLVEFLIRHSGSSTEDILLQDKASDSSVRTTCENVLHVLATAVPHTDKILWPHLLEYIVPIHYTGSIGTVCKNAATIATKLRHSESEMFEIEYSELNTIHKPWALMSRLFVLVGHLTHERISILQLMKALAPTFNKNIVAAWDTNIPKMINHLQSEKSGSDIQLDWEEQVLRLLGNTLNDIDEEEWCLSFGRVLVQQNKFYAENPKGKAFLFKCVGEVLVKVHDEEFVRGSLNAIYEATKHADYDEREGCAKAFGRTSLTHLKTVLNVLEILNTTTTCKKPSGLLSFFMESKTDINDSFRPTVVLCFASVFKCAQMVQLAPKIESTLITHIAPYTRVAKTEDMVVTLLQAIDACACALFPVRLGGYFMQNTRNEILSNVLTLFSNAESNQVMDIALKCITDLLKLHALENKEEWEPVLQNCLLKIYTLKPEDSDALIADGTLDQLDNLITYLLVRDATSDNLNCIIGSLERWLCSPRPEERRRSIRSLVTLLKSYSPVIHFGGEKFVHFNPVGSLLSLLIPRCFDSNRVIQQYAIDGIITAFRISAILDGFSPDYYGSALAELGNMQLNFEENDKLLKSIGKIIANHLPHDQLIALLQMIFEALSDTVLSSAIGVSSFLNIVIDLRGAALFQHVDTFLQILHSRLDLIEDAEIKNAAIQIVHKLGKHHLTPVVNYLLNCSTPYNSAVVSSWRILAQDPELGGAILINFLQYVTKSDHVYLVPDSRNRKLKLYLAQQKSISVLLALKELFHQIQMEGIAREYFSQLFASLILLCGIFVNAYPPPPPGFNKEKFLWPTLPVFERVDNNYPIRIATEAFRAFLLCAHMEDFLSFVSEYECWLNFESPSLYLESIVCMARALCAYAPRHLPAAIHHLNFALTSNHVAYRVVTSAFFAELISRRCNGEEVLLELVMNNLISKLADSSNTVRKLCVKGLANIAHGSAEEIQKYSPTVLSAMVVGLDDKDDPQGDIILEAMNGLSKIFSLIESTFVEPVLISIVVRIRPYFENTKPNIRAASFRLFGDLSRFGVGECHAAFTEQIQNSLVSLLLHLNDPDECVVKACKYALRSVGPLMSSEGMNVMFQKHLLDDAVLHYGEFMNDLSKIMIKDFPDKIPFYVTTNASQFKSSWSVIHSNALMLVGYLLSNLSTKQQEQIPKESICTALTLSLKSDSDLVRIKAAEAMSLLHEY